MKLTDEQLSIVLGEHEAGELRRYGRSGMEHGGAHKNCMYQAALNEDSLYDASVLLIDGVHWFDNNYQPTWTSDEFLRRIDREGL